VRRGQTQSQYLSFGTGDDGKAEAETTLVIFFFIARMCTNFFEVKNHILRAILSATGSLAFSNLFRSFLDGVTSNSV
jgi:hypothetical protein